MCLIYFATNRKPNRKVNTTDFGKVFSEDGIANLRFGRAEFIEDYPFRLQLEPEKLVPDDRDFGIDHKKFKPWKSTCIFKIASRNARAE